jgi:hypothetical protein
MVELDHHLSTSSRPSLDSRILSRMSTNSYRILFIALFAIVNSVIPISQSNAIGSGACTSTVGSDSGVVVANSGGFCYVAFTSTGSNSWTAPSGVTSVDLLIIAGGGAGGGGAWGGGGGAGELVSYTSYAVTSSSATSLSVGSGGTPGAATLTASANRSSNGINSWVASSSGVVAQGGGAGASYAYSDISSYSVGADGGSGGGGTENTVTNTGGTTTKTSSGTRTGYGNNGGRGGAGGSTQSGGGGGGAGGIGTDAGTGIGGNGGGGTNTFATWLSAINSGMSGITGWQTATSTGFIAGGGGGGTTNTAGSAGAGGAGRGGSNSTFYNGEAAVTNTGSGGGGSSYGGSPKIGGSGGSGLIIIRYAILNATVNSFNLTGNATTATYRSTATININVSTPAKITFRAKGVVIAGCKNKTASGSGSSYTATCSWKPSFRGQVNLTASIVPTGPWGNVTSSPLSIRVTNRTGTRA